MNRTEKGPMYDGGAMKVVFIACVVIVLSVLITGSISWFITRNAIVEKLKSQDMVYVIGSIAAKIEGRVERAQESALLLATDPAVVQWIAGAETDARLGRYAVEKLTGLARNYDYSNAFIVSAVTKNYWAESGRIIDVMSETDPDDNWFFETLKSGRAVELNIDSNKERSDTFVFVNALMGDVKKPLAVAGVGLNLKEIAKEFQSYKIGQDSNLWLADRNGKIHLSEDVEHIGLYLNDFVPPSLSHRIVSDAAGSSASPRVLEYVDRKGNTVDLVYQATKATDWKLVFQMPRSESVGVLDSIRINTLIAGIVSLIVIIFIFYFISHRVADPLRRAVLLGQEMERQVAQRTQELEEQNRKIMDSIDYARRLQESILPSTRELAEVFADYFIIWRPRDQVGGDFYWVRQLDENRSLIAVVDCTGHGVPGAFMTMSVNSILDNIVLGIRDNPAFILEELNRRVKETLHRSDPRGMSDDGLDIGLCYVEGNSKLVFAGAKMSLYVKREGEVQMIRGSNKSIGYRRSVKDMKFTNTEWQVKAGDVFVLTTDGYIDQNGGNRDYPMGRKLFVSAFSEQEPGEPLSGQQKLFESRLADYMGGESQRDDITVLGFSFRVEGRLS